MIKNLSPTKNERINLIVYCLFLIISFFGMVYGNSIREDHSFLRIWTSYNLIVLLLGIPFLFLQRRANLPDFFEKKITNRNRFLLPGIIGSVFGILDVIIIKWVLHPEPYSELPPFLQPFPYSMFLYFSGAFEVEVFYRLIPLTVILFIGKMVADGKYFNVFFIVAALLTSLREPLEQLPSGGTYFIIYSLLTGFMMNYLQVIHYKKSGFLASLSLRLGHYLFWHILLGIYVQFIELK